MDENLQPDSDRLDVNREESSVISDIDNEGERDYVPGGYHPVAVNDLFLNRYLVLQKLGWGHFSTVWLCKDLNHDTYVALKVQKSASNYTEAAYDEIEILMKVSNQAADPAWVATAKEYHPGLREVSREQCYVVQLLNSFTHSGPNGRHVCMVFEVLGVNLLQIIKRFDYQGIPLPICRSISRQVLIGLDYLHRICNVIHTDLKPENVLVQLTHREIEEVLLQGKLSGPVNILPTPFTELPAVPSSPKEQSQLNAKKEMKKAKRKKYKQRKKAEARLLKEITNAGLLTTEPPKNSKKKHESKRTAPSQEESLEEIRVKIADLGNGCWFNQHFSTEIQTRQYRSPEVIIGAAYNSTADLWSFACMLFELATGEFLFDPKSGNNFNKDDDHLAQMIETLGPIPKDFALSGLSSKELFTRDGRLRRIQRLHRWPLKDVLVEKYRIKETEAKALANFLAPMLVYQPDKRTSAQTALKSPWLSMPPDRDYRVSEEQFRGILAAQELRVIERVRTEGSSSLEVLRDVEAADADDELDLGEESDSEEDKENLPNDYEENLEYHDRMLRLKQTL